MKIELNHTIVPAKDKEESVRFYERILGFKYEGPDGTFRSDSHPQSVAQLSTSTTASRSNHTTMPLRSGKPNSTIFSVA